MFADSKVTITYKKRRRDAEWLRNVRILIEADAYFARGCTLKITWWGA